ncbi:MAG TPA: glutathione S-transferase family protein [Alphaproteobacteria bacterium]|nr:glutathione S-transferase family protein [Alphaproteobacteria bacterium]
MSRLKIYGSARSRATRVLWLAKELGLEFEHVAVAANDPKLKEPAFLKVNPTGRIPAIEDDGVAMGESLAINLYLARKYGGHSALAPATPAEEARLLQWTCWAMTDLEGPMGTVYLNRGFLPEDKRDPKAAEAAEAQAQKPLAMLDGVLAKTPYLLGDRFTVADLNLAGVLSLARIGAVDMSKFPHVAAWAKRCHDRPAAAEVRAMAAAS